MISADAAAFICATFTTCLTRNPGKEPITMIRATGHRTCDVHPETQQYSWFFANWHSKFLFPPNSDSTRRPDDHLHLTLTKLNLVIDERFRNPSRDCYIALLILLQMYVCVRFSLVNCEAPFFRAEFSLWIYEAFLFNKRCVIMDIQEGLA